MSQPPRKLVDYHDFEVWRYEDDSIDLHVGRDGCDIDYEVAVLEANVVARSLGEERTGCGEVFAMRVYEDGQVSTLWRDPRGSMGSWARYKWLKQRLNGGTYDVLVGHPEPPAWLCTLLWAVEFAVGRIAARWGVMRGVYTVEVVETEEESVLGATQKDNVIPFPRPSR